VPQAVKCSVIPIWGGSWTQDWDYKAALTLLLQTGHSFIFAIPPLGPDASDSSCGHFQVAWMASGHVYLSDPLQVSGSVRM